MAFVDTAVHVPHSRLKIKPIQNLHIVIGPIDQYLITLFGTREPTDKDYWLIDISGVAMDEVRKQLNLLPLDMDDQVCFHAV